MTTTTLTRAKLWRQFAVYVTGVLLAYASYVAILNLQSSMNIKEGLGTTTASISFCVSFFCVLLCTPTFVRYFSLKTSLIVCELGFLIYILLNFYPAYYTLIPGAFCTGFSEATIWTVMSLANVNIGKNFAVWGSETTDVYIHKITGYFFTAIQFCQVIGNSVTSLFLKMVKVTTNSTTTTIVSNSTTTYNISSNSSVEEYYKYRYCGYQDCQDEDAIDENLEQYVPEETSRYIVLIVLAGFTILAIVIHFVFLDLSTHENSFATKEKLANGNNASSVELITSSKKERKKATVYHNFITTLRETFVVMCHKRLLLLMPLTVYSGLYMGFVFSELTRSYASCVLGVSKVGLCMALFGLADAIFSFIFGKFGKVIGRTWFLLACFLLDLSVWLYCLLWQPNMESSWSVYVIFFAYGIGDGIWQTATNVMHLEHSPKNEDIAVSLWNMYVCAGLALQFGLSKYFCMTVKIYGLIALLVVAFLCVCYDEMLLAKSKKKYEISHSDAELNGNNNAML